MTQVECHGKMKAAVRVVGLQAKEYQRFLANRQQLGERLEEMFPAANRKNNPADTLISTSSL